jgi:hypothetical protein
MTIIISPEELEPNFQAPWKLGLIHNLSIDYADNAIWATFEKKEVIIFNFKWWGLVLDNRWCGYSISSGAAGIMINFDKNN